MIPVISPRRISHGPSIRTGHAVIIRTTEITEAHNMLLILLKHTTLLFTTLARCLFILFHPVLFCVHILRGRTGSFFSLVCEVKCVLNLDVSVNDCGIGLLNISFKIVFYSFQDCYSRFRVLLSLCRWLLIL